MGRIFSLLTAAAVLVILIAVGCVYWLSRASIEQTRQHSATAVANAVASTLSQQIDLLNRTLDKMARDPEVVTAVAQKDPNLLTGVAARLEHYFPDALKIRLLLPGVNEVDESNIPRMGFADLDMVRETFTSNQLPRIQGQEGVDRHLAIARRIVHNDQVIGVILASLNFDFFKQSLQAVAISDGYIELRQAKQVLGKTGEQINIDQSESVQAKVPKTDWDINYYSAANEGIFGIVLIIIIVAVALLLTSLAYFVGYRRISGLLTQDLNILLNACKDMVTHKPPGSYPAELSEISDVITALMQFKQVMEHNEHSARYGRIDEFPGYDLNVNFIEEDKFLDNLAVESNDKTEIIELAVDHKKLDEMDSIYRAYDIRGVVGKTLTRERVYDIGRALGSDARDHGCQLIVVGRDGRTSSPMLAEALTEGIVSTGRNILDIGMVPTPLLYFVALHTEGRSGVMITGSNNPAAYNGLKMLIDGEALAGERIQKLRQSILNQRFATGENGSVEKNTRYINEYIGTIADDIHLAKPMVVVLDCGNGVTGELGPKLLKTLGCEVIELFCDVDGNFPNHYPDPSNPDNLAELTASVKHYKADLGIAFDSDGDRIGVVDSNGKIIWPDRQMMVFAKDVLDSRPGSEIIFDVKCTRHLGNQITKYGGKPLMWKTGHSFMKAKLKETGAALAGEMSGHIFFNDRWFGFDDALYSAARMLEILSKDERSSAEIFSQFPESIKSPEINILLEEGEKFIFMEKIFAEVNFADGIITDIDGMRIDFTNGWGLVRASNTTSSLIVCFEAESNDALVNIQNKFKQLIKKIKPDLVLPF